MNNEFDVIFNANYLNHIQYVFLTRRFPNDLPEAQLISFDMARQDGEVVLGKRYKTKLITFEVYIVAPDREQYELALDTLKKKTRGVNKTLTLVQRGQNRQYTATLKTLTHTHIEGGKANIVLVFECNKPFGLDTTFSSFTLTGITESPHVDSANPFDGSAPARPKVSVTLNDIVGGGTRDITIYNSVTGQGVTVSRSGWEIGDVVQFFMKEQYITVNGAVVDYNGVFPAFEPETEFLAYSDTFNSRDVDILVQYLKEFL